MEIRHYLYRIEGIRKCELKTRIEIAQDIGIAYNTYTRLETVPESCSVKTLRKIRAFVENWELNNPTFARSRHVK